MLYELLTGHPDRASRELVFLADLTVELRAWPRDTWAKVWDVWMQHEDGSGGRWRLWTVQETVAR